MTDEHSFIKDTYIIVKNQNSLTLNVYKPGITAHIELQICFSPKNVNTNLMVGYLKCQGERKLEGLYTSVCLRHSSRARILNTVSVTVYIYYINRASRACQLHTPTAEQEDVARPCILYYSKTDLY